MPDSFDVIVIGGGPGGYVCAIRAAQLGLKAAVVESRGALGGTCTNVGCIPSKALLQSSHLFEEASEAFGDFGIKISKPKLDLKVMLGHKDKVVEANVSGVSFLFKKNKIDWKKGRASFAFARQYNWPELVANLHRHVAGAVPALAGLAPRPAPLSGAAR